MNRSTSQSCRRRIRPTFRCRRSRMAHRLSQGPSPIRHQPRHSNRPRYRSPNSPEGIRTLDGESEWKPAVVRYLGRPEYSTISTNRNPGAVKGDGRDHSARGPEYHRERLAKLVVGGFGLNRVAGKRVDDMVDWSPRTLRRTPTGSSGRQKGALIGRGSAVRTDLKERPLNVIAPREISDALVAIARIGMGGHEEDLLRRDPRRLRWSAHDARPAVHAPEGAQARRWRGPPACRWRRHRPGEPSRRLACVLSRKASSYWPSSTLPALSSLPGDARPPSSADAESRAHVPRSLGRGANARPRQSSHLHQFIWLSTLIVPSRTSAMNCGPRPESDKSCIASRIGSGPLECRTARRSRGTHRRDPRHVFQCRGLPDPPTAAHSSRTPSRALRRPGNKHDRLLSRTLDGDVTRHGSPC